MAKCRAAQKAERLARGGRGTRRRSVRRPRRRPGEHYTTDSYRAAVRRTCAAAGIGAWTPHQLRHPFATRVRKEFAPDAARGALGHAGADVTLDYADPDRAKAVDVARRLG